MKKQFDKNTQFYFQFPLSFLRGVFHDKSKIENIIYYGMYNYSSKVNYYISDVARHLIYCIYRKELPNNISNFIFHSSFEYVGCNEDYNGFDVFGKLEAYDEIAELETAFNDNLEFKIAAIRWYQLYIATEQFKLKIDNYENFLRRSEKLKAIEGEPMLMVNIDMIMKFHNNSFNTDFDIAQLLAFLSIKSIIGLKSHTKTNKQMILCRMFGYKSSKDINLIDDEFFNKYSNRYHYDKLTERLQTDWNVNIYSNRTRGIFVSIDDKYSLESLIKYVESKRTITKIKIIKNRKKEILKRL